MRKLRPRVVNCLSLLIGEWQGLGSNRVLRNLKTICYYSPGEDQGSSPEPSHSRSSVFWSDHRSYFSDYSCSIKAGSLEGR